MAIGYLHSVLGKWLIVLYINIVDQVLDALKNLPVLFSPKHTPMPKSRTRKPRKANHVPHVFNKTTINQNITQNIHYNQNPPAEKKSWLKAIGGFFGALLAGLLGSGDQ
ncbi:hypothetical protein [Hymenobacter busanensis]|uniref:hypothetical protein n=1 Tax=Hymenobacter busanensis TaxID=2607656 RepID=UPI0014223873|nr:hypothetical protein [Hymenobacter busanensis]